MALRISPRRVLEVTRPSCVMVILRLWPVSEVTGRGGQVPRLVGKGVVAFAFVFVFAFALEMGRSVGVLDDER